METLTAITLALFITFLGAEIGKKFNYPRIIGQLSISLLLTIPILNHFFTNDAKIAIDVFSSLGVVFLLLLTGFELNLEELKKNTKDALIIAISAAIIPFSLGFITGYFLGYDTNTCFILGACLSVTAEGTKVALLLEMKKLKTKLGSIMLGAGILDDIFEIAFLTIILFLAHSSHLNTTESSGNFFIFAIKLTIFIGLIITLTKYLPKWIQNFKHKHSEIALLSAVILLGLIIASFSEFIGLGSLIGAFIAGVLLQKSFINESEKEKESHSLKMMIFAFIIPFFFINIGLHFDYNIFLENPFLTILIIFIAILGKLIGTFITKPFVNLSWSQLHIIGWGMNSRGVMELVMAQIALSAGLISSELYSAIVFMAIATTTLFPFMFKILIKKNPNIMD